MACIENQFQPAKAFMHGNIVMCQVTSAPVPQSCAKPDPSMFYYCETCSLLSFSISSTLMEMESIESSGRSTPAMMNGQGSARSSATKTMAYSCCWDLCPQCFNSSPDLAEHIRGIHVDGQTGGVSRLRSLLILFVSVCRVALQASVPFFCCSLTLTVQTPDTQQDN